MASESSDHYEKILASAAAAELPAKAARLVKQAKAADLEVTTIKVGTAALTLRPAAAPAIVGAMARAVPDMAPVAAGTAVTREPKQAAVIARAAAAAAPDQAGKIVVAMCRVVPKECGEVAVAVSQAAPGSTRKILDEVALGVPELMPEIEKALGTAHKRNVYGGSPYGSTTVSASGTGGGGASSQVTLPPLGKPSGTPGGRDYSKP